MRAAIAGVIGALWVSGAQAQAKPKDHVEQGPVVAGQCAASTAISTLKGKAPGVPAAFACDRAAINFFADGAGVMVVFPQPGPTGKAVSFSGLIGPDDAIIVQRVYFADQALPASQGACRQQADGQVLTEIDCDAMVGGRRQMVKFVVDPAPAAASPAGPSAPTSP